MVGFETNIQYSRKFTKIFNQKSFNNS